MTLNTNDPKEKREETKNQAVALREETNFGDALKLFEQVITWDEENDNEKGKIDVLGHIKITYTNMAQNAETDKVKKELLKLAMETSEDAMQIKRTHVSVIHSVSARVDFADYLDNEDAKHELLRRALSDLETEMKTFPGSQAHKAWPANLKAQIEYKMGDVKKALETLTTAETWLHEGYEEEIKSDDQAEMKLKVWITGLFLTKAKIYQELNKPILAKIYATAVKEFEDTAGNLNTRKQQAQRILSELK